MHLLRITVAAKRTSNVHLMPIVESCSRLVTILPHHPLGIAFNVTRLGASWIRKLKASCQATANHM